MGKFLDDSSPRPGRRPHRAVPPFSPSCNAPQLGIGFPAGPAYIPSMIRRLPLVLLALAAWRAHAWNTPADLTLLPGDETGARVAQDSAGRVHLVWLGGDDSTSSQVRYQMWNGILWTPPVPISDSGAGGCDVAVDGHGDVHAVWHAGADPEEIYYRKRTTGTWGGTVTLSNSGSRSLRPRLAVHPAGDTVFVVWQEGAQTGGQGDILARQFSSNAWGTVENVSHDNTLSRNADTVIDAADTCHIVWEDAGDNHLYYRQRTADGAYSAKTALDDTAGPSRGASITTAENGRLHVVWHQGNGDWEIFCRTFNGTAWEPPVNVSQRPDPDHADHAAHVATDPNGEAHIVWTDSQHIHYAHTVSGAMRPGYIISPGANQGDPVCVVDAGGVLHALWPNRAPGSWDLFHARHTLPDNNPPGGLSSLRATPANQQVLLEWAPPFAIDFSGVMIRWKTNGLPTSRTDGDLAVDAGRDQNSFVHRGLVNGATYQYAAFAYDAEPNYSYPINASAVPFAAPMTNLLINPAMEGGFAAGLATGWQNYRANDPNNALVFSEDTAHYDSAPSSQSIMGLDAANLPATGFSAAGLFQVVTNVQPGAVYLFVGHQDIYTPDFGADGQRYLHSFGINTTGDTSPGSSFGFGIVGNASWMGPGHQFYNNNPGGAPLFPGFHRARTAFMAQSNRISLWTGVAIDNTGARDDVAAKFNADTHCLFAFDFPTNIALVNGDFEGPTLDLGNGSDVLPANWLPAGGGVGQINSWTVETNSARVQNGLNRGARIWSRRGMVNAGLMQRVAVPPGQMVTFSAWARASGQDNTEASVGIDPYGRGDITPFDVVRVSTPSATWTQLTASAVAQGPFVTVFVRSESQNGGANDQWSDFDDATLAGGGTDWTSIVPAGAVWKYLPITNDVGTAWREPGHDDAGWSSGPAQLGYGDGDEATWIPFYPDQIGGKNISTYFRHRFVLPVAARYTNLIVRLLRDDGGIVYLNGVEVFRSNMTNGPVTWTTLALSNVAAPDENTTFFSTNTASTLLREGTNVLAVEIHQATAVSQDISFDLQLLGLVDPTFTTNRPPAVALTAPAPDRAFPAFANITVSADAFDHDGDVPLVEFFAGTTQIGSVVYPPFSMTWSNVPAGTYFLTARATDSDGAQTDSPPVSIRVGATTLVSLGSLWRYKDDGSDQGVDWRAPEFIDAAWASGPAELGYGDEGAPDYRPEATVVNSGGPFSHYITTYFRHQFEVPDPALVASLRLRLLRDDGGIVYLNGVEVSRSNIPPGPVDYLTLAANTVNSGPDETTYFPTNLNASLLRPGGNVLAAEVHQAYVTSSDLSFDLELVAFPPETLPRLAANISGGIVLLSWPGWAGHFTLAQATNLAPPTVWIPVTNAPLTDNSEWTLTLPVLSNTTRFYRLQTP